MTWLERFTYFQDGIEGQVVLGSFKLALVILYYRESTKRGSTHYTMHTHFEHWCNHATPHLGMVTLTLRVCYHTHLEHVYACPYAILSMIFNRNLSNPEQLGPSKNDLIREVSTVRKKKCIHFHLVRSNLSLFVLHQ